MISSIILALHLMGVMPLNSAISTLYLVAILLFIAEIGIVSFGLLTLNAFMALYAAYVLQTGPSAFFGLEIGWGLFFGVSFVEFSTLIIGIIIWRNLKNRKNPTGTEGMIGQSALILDWNTQTGRVQFEGEPWNANSKTPMEFSKGDKCLIIGIEKNILIIGV